MLEFLLSRVALFVKQSLPQQPTAERSPSGRTPRASRSLLLQGQPAPPVLGRVVRLTVLALHAQEVELHRGAGIAVVAKDLHAHREGRERGRGCSTSSVCI